MARIYAPNKEYSGRSAGLPFACGMAETEDPHLLDWFRKHGYKVEESPVGVDSKEEAPGEGALNKKSVKAKKGQA